MFGVIDFYQDDLYCHDEYIGTNCVTLQYVLSKKDPVSEGTFHHYIGIPVSKELIDIVNNVVTESKH